MLTRTCILSAALCSLVALPGITHAGIFSEVASALDADDPFDLHATVEYDFESRSSKVKREFVGLTSISPDSPMPLVKDLVYSGSRHLIRPKIQLGVFKDLAVSFAMPITIFERGNLSFDQGASPCIFPGQGGTATCINADNSTTVGDGLLPSNGFDSGDPSGPGFTSGSRIFEGVGRSGLDQLHLGFAWAPMNQKRDVSKPTWTVGAQVRLSVGSIKRFNRANPGSSAGVSPGVHEAFFYTAMTKRMSWAEPYFRMWYQAPLGTRGGSPFQERNPGFGQQGTGKQRQAGTEFGTEIIVWEKKEDKNWVSIDARARLEAFFEGRAYTEMWEVFSYAGDATSGGPLILDSDPVTSGVQAISYPGVSNVENYLRMGGSLGVRAHLGEMVNFGATFSLQREQTHLISFADAGTDLPTCDGSTSDCETDNNNVINQGTTEVNPFHVNAIDQVGSRYRVGDISNIGFIIDATIFF